MFKNPPKSSTNFRHLPPDPFLDDFNRVVLDPADGLQDSDYINASYVDVSTV